MCSTPPNPRRCGCSSRCRSGHAAAPHQASGKYSLVNKEEMPMMNLNRLMAVAIGVLALAGIARAEDYKVSDPAALSKALAGATVKLDQGIKATAAQGMPISAKFE